MARTLLSALVVLAVSGLTSCEVLFDEEREVWAALGVSGQPVWLLYDAGGSLLGRGAGAIAVAEVEALLPQP